MRKTIRFGNCAAALLSALSIASYGSGIGIDKYATRRNSRTAVEQNTTTANRILRDGFITTNSLIENNILVKAPMAMPFNSLTRVDSVQSATDAPVDFDGDGKTDYVVTRNEGGSPGQLVWYYAQNGGTATTAFNWGLSTDWVLSDDFDGDGKDDYVVWRGAPAGQAAFYIFQSATSTFRIESFGQQGDIPSVIGDYDGDGKADIAVYRPGATAGAQSLWYYIPSLNNPTGAATVVSWGLRSDIVAPGDYNGDGKNDFAIARDDGTGHLVWWRRLSDGTLAPVVGFGLTADFITPGDYDGDGKTDIATVRSVNSQMQWNYLASSNGSANFAVWGLGTDFAVPGDYDGDSKWDFAVYRRSSTPGQSAFWSLNSSNGAARVFAWGSAADFPVANANTF